MEASCKTLKLSLGHIRIEGDLVLSELAISGTDVQFSVDGLGGANRLAIKAMISPADFAELVSSRLSESLESSSVELQEECFVIRGKKRKIIGIPVEVQCHLRVLDQRYIHIDLSKGEAFGIGIQGLVKPIEDQMNPVFDAAILPFPVSIASVSVSRQGLEITGFAGPLIKFGT